jgi:hypothetical protein
MYSDRDLETYDQQLQRRQGEALRDLVTAIEHQSMLLSSINNHLFELVRLQRPNELLAQALKEEKTCDGL